MLEALERIEQLLAPSPLPLRQLAISGGFQVVQLSGLFANVGAPVLELAISTDRSEMRGVMKSPANSRDLWRHTWALGSEEGR